jgi:phosphatidylinositol glycan class T
MLRNWLGVGLWLVCQSHLALADEHFNEELRIRPLRDGRLYTHFAFKTLLEGAVPRSPGTLSIEDERELGLHHASLTPFS